MIWRWILAAVVFGLAVLGAYCLQAFGKALDIYETNVVERDW